MYSYFTYGIPEASYMKESRSWQQLLKRTQLKISLLSKFETRELSPIYFSGYFFHLQTK